MTLAQKIGQFIGMGGERSAPPPRYTALADGLILTDAHAEAWYVLGSSNTDLMSEPARDAELDQAIAALTHTLSGMDCHLRVLWSPLHAADYMNEAEAMFAAGDWQRWAALRVRRLEQIGLPSRHLLLGVKLTERTGAAQSAGRRTVQEGLGIGAPSLSNRELAKLDATMRRLGRRLEASPWKAQPASVEMLAWMISREQHRAAPIPAAPRGQITGAQLATLTRGRILPYPDHLRVVGADGKVVAWTATLTMTGFPEEMTVPGAGEWLRVLSEINYVPEPTGDDDDPDALILPVSPEASVRFKVQHKRDAIKTVEDARRAAKEQRRSAARHSAEDPGREIAETEDTMAGLTRDMRRDDVTLVEDHPRLVVTSTVSLADLRARIDAVVDYYGGTGIDIDPAEDEQRELWLETQPGDRLRIPDLGHVRDVTALAGSWFWGGARVGDDEGPIAGYLTGSTPGPFRNDVTGGSDRGDATTTAYVGRSGRGKSTAVMLSTLDAAFRGAFTLALDFKGDLGGLTVAAAEYGLPSRLVETGSRYAGFADLFVLLAGEASERAQIEVPAQLGIALPPHLRARGAETPIQKAVNAVVAEGNPATWRVIEHLRASSDPLAKEAGDALFELAQTGVGAPFMGRPTSETIPLRPEPGVWVVQMPGLSLPDLETDREDWNVSQRLSVALMHSMLAFGVVTAGRKDLRGLRKLVAVPEVHVLTATREGSAFLSYVARVGRALGTSLLLDTQDPESLARLTGVVEQLTTVAGFQLTTASQQDALAELLGLPAGPHTRSLIRSVGLHADGEIRHGHCIVRDRRDQAATVQWDIPSWELKQLLDTSPKAAADSGDGAVTMDKVTV
ncbi:ATP-binding protein [Kitasatospora sp. NPDC048722]|uniref:ATP-binding protein n=1 Tax=Kitasatospora sp. NPDC048722 TaxID=3155639 RepID=UPI00340DF9EC